MNAPEQSNKSHRGTKKTGAKKKLHQNGQNKKAFAVNAPKKLERMASRSADVGERRLHVPMVDRTPEDDPPPVIIGVVGPPGTGKTTLIKSLVRRLTKTTLTEVKGPITVVSGKRRRLTFIEVSNDLNTMIDTAKIVDLVLLMIDGNFGFEMETMEFLNIVQHHGMPRVLGVATHLDLFKSQSTLRTSKKRLKHRFWTEVYQGAKLFYLSGVINGRYPDREILNLSRFISVMKFRPLKWRNEHPYLLADRITDLTYPQDIAENPKCDRKVALYGYLHGTSLPPSNAHVHIAGVGDYYVNSIEKLPDPCPTPYFEQKLEELERERIKEASKAGEAVARTPRRRKRLEDKQKIIYAPMSDVGGVLMDKDAVYIDVGDKEHFVKGEEKGEGERLVTSLQEVPKTLKERFEEGPGLKLFSTSEELNEPVEASESDSENSVSSDEEESMDGPQSGRKEMRMPNVYRGDYKEAENLDEIPSDDDLEDIGYENEFKRREDVDSESHVDEDLEFVEDSALSSDEDQDEDEDKFRNSAKKLKGSVKKRWNINKLMYLPNIEPSDVIKRWKGLYNDEDIEHEEEDEDDEFFKKKELKNSEEDLDHFIPFYNSLDDLKAKFSNVFEGNGEKGESSDFLSKFMTTPNVSKKNDNSDAEDNEESDYGDFEDLEAEENQDEGDESGKEDAEEGESGEGSDDDFADFEAEAEKDENGLTVEQERELNAKKKSQLAMQFEEEEDREFGVDDPEGDTEADTWYEFQKNKMAKQLEINKAEFEAMDEASRLRIEGYKAGSYVKLVFNNVPCELIENFQPEFPLIVGGLLPSESNFGIMNVRIRRHRWHKKILKSQDPLILSLGWRRFQTLPIYTTSDSRTRNRMLKYTPEHAYCTASFYGPFVAPNTSFVGFNVVANSDTSGSFRVAATGVVEDLNSSVEIVKKLKLVGYPYKIFRNTAFIKDMFSNALEVAKFEGASIRTVSGIRGEIKRALSSPEGCFRGTFEDKILMSDIVFLKTWYPVKVKKFYNPVTSLLLSEHTEWKGMRLTGKVRADIGIETPMNEDSSYKKIERSERKFNPLRVPTSIKSSLPFKSQIHQMKPRKKESYMSKRAVVLGGEERKARDLIQKIATIKKEKDAKRKSKKDEKAKERLKSLAKKEELRIQKEKERKKEYFASAGKKRSFNGSSGSSKKQHN
ncbi:Piso0_004595 [Millerozyma farinosa CBS 7064]|uniref:Piso0_004595 protein n=1 Tax=Pichia sorbitophila (strain ATCC MYA-4447 / BCRC 22081 / CBS 7064 / NBRC 10061 / NRRL Y-12695) TaxID=559304 RepID=G8Y983_PICSO|nr:Piso0_004595 [Millerozyma farinosa CBS 7064]CCE85028.1 Piso0_004595 [Millerozyma farinosa CBS 7064]